MVLNLTLEEVLERASVQLKERINYSINAMRKAEKVALKYSEDGFFLGFSGGKDSQALYHLAHLAGVKFTAHFSPTSIDPPPEYSLHKKELS